MSKIFYIFKIQTFENFKNKSKEIEFQCFMENIDNLEEIYKFLVNTFKSVDTQTTLSSTILEENEAQTGLMTFHPKFLRQSFDVVIFKTGLDDITRVAYFQQEVMIKNLNEDVGNIA